MGKEKFDTGRTGAMTSYALLLLCAVLTSVSAFFVYKNTETLLEERLKQRLISIVATATLQFDTSDIQDIWDESDVDTIPFIRVTNQLIDIRNANEDIKYAYILRATENKNIFKFVADADSMDPYAEIDLNGDGVLNDDDALVIPGDEYDAADYPILVEQAGKHPSVDDELIPDQWGLILAAYAPIKDKKGETAAILGIDVDVTEYIQRIRATAIPFLLLIAFLLLILTVLTVSLVKMWGSRVDLLKELDRQKDELISIVSHQLATPATSVKWYIEMLLDGDAGELTENQKKELKTVQGVTADLVDLIGMILDVSRIQLGRMKVDRGELDLGEFFTDVLAVIEPKAKLKKQQFIKAIPKSLPVASLDKRLMRMTLENLLSNAVKYTPDGGKVELNVTVKDHTLRYEVKDTGCGIPKEDQEKIFGKLFRATNVRNTEGNGLGLFAAKGAAEAQGGKVWFTSAAGKGTTFFVEVPIAGWNEKTEKQS
ncbi:hypothetical protein COU80_00845 [Candidatus Peregrinibacteria bacterium CG10_big_fil_rev_8_21_14_0_10_55_24]|nr:MAG: hypothetical protein COU80_00845 [Candidatus Peregrinibacteria bacterium CG10_big_fil_rev_8_21_14_0_10_55_24]